MLGQSAVEKAASELQKLQQARLRLETELLAGEVQLQEWRTQAADLELSALLDEGPPPARPDVAGLELKLAGLRGARPKLWEKLRAAVKAVAHEQAEVVRREAAKKAKLLADYSQQRHKLLEALSRHTDCSWVVDTSADVVLVQEGGRQIRTGRGKREDRGIGLAAEIEGIRRQAAQIEAEARGACEGGAVEGGSLEAILKAIAAHPLGPTPQAVREWYRQTEAQQAALWDAQYPEGVFRAAGGGAHTVATSATRRTVFELRWDANGSIDRSRSRAVSSLAPLVEGGEPGSPVPLPTTTYTGRID